MKIRVGNASVRIFLDNRKIMFRCFYHEGVVLDTPFIREAYLFLRNNK